MGRIGRAGIDDIPYEMESLRENIVQAFFTEILVPEPMTAVGTAAKFAKGGIVIHQDFFKVCVEFSFSLFHENPSFFSELWLV